jgi:hypothetical protein
MPSRTTTVVYVVLLIGSIVAVDLLFFENQFWRRLLMNVAIVLIFAVFYFRALRP